MVSELGSGLFTRIGFFPGGHFRIKSSFIRTDVRIELGLNV